MVYKGVLVDVRTRPYNPPIPWGRGVASSALDQMLNAIGQYPVLSPRQQLEHARTVRKWLKDEEGNLRPAEGPGAPTARQVKAGQRAKRRMIETNMRLVVTVAHKLSGRGVPLEDLIQEGAFGLNRAIELFDPTRGYAFSTYSFWWIRQSMIRAIANQANVIRIPVNSLDLFHRAERFVADYQALHGRQPSHQEIEKGLDVKPGQMGLIREAGLALRCLSLDFKLSDDPDANTFMEVAADSGRHHQAEEAQVAMINHATIAELLPELSPVEQRVINARYSLGLTVAEVGRQEGMSRFKVAETERRALNRLRRLWVEVRAGTLERRPQRLEEGLLPFALEEELYQGEQMEMAL